MNGAKVKWMLVPWAATFALITYQSFTKGNGLPRPSRLTSTCLVFTLLALLSEASAPLATSLGWGLVVGLLLKNPAALSVVPAAGDPYNTNPNAPSNNNSSTKAGPSTIGKPPSSGPTGPSGVTSTNNGPSGPSVAGG